MKSIFILIFVLFLTAYFGFAQHEHHQQPVQKDTLPGKADTLKKKSSANSKPDHTDHSMHDMGTMNTMPSHAYSRNLPMSRNGSGTGWNPDASPMYMWMKQGNKTDWMFHGNIFLR